MEHVVFYPSADGTPAFRRVPSLTDAVNFVEHLRNSEGVTEFSVHALAEVPLSFRPYYHVEVSGADARPVAVHAEPAPVEEAAPAPAELPIPAQPAIAEIVAAASAPVPSTPFAEAPPVKAPAPVAAAVEAQVETPVEPVAEAVTAEPVVAEAPPAEAPLGDTQEVVPASSGRRSMGFFARS